MKSLLKKVTAPFLAVGAMLGFATAQASVVDTTVMDAHVADVTADITALAGYGITIILAIMAVTIVYSLLKRGR